MWRSGDRPELRLPAAGDAVLPSISRLMLHFGNIFAVYGLAIRLETEGRGS